MGEENKMTKERNAQLDIAKGLGMAIVVLFHARILSGVWTQFHMPLFAFLSGILYREQYNTSLNQVCVYTKKKIKGCYVPFVIYNFVFLMLHNLFYKIHIYGELGGKKYYNIKDFLHQIIAILTMGGRRKSAWTNVVFNCNVRVYDFIYVYSILCEKVFRE